MLGLGIPEILIILFIILLIFGAGKIPEISSAIGKSIKSFKRSMKDDEKKEETASKNNDKHKISQ